MADIMLSVQAYCKLLLHAAKYPHCAVNGVLLAEDTKGKGDRGSIRFVDCIPLFHISLGLAPLLEVALFQIDYYCRSNGLVIGGYYQANENYDDSSMNFIAKTIGKKIHDNNQDAVVLMVDNRKVGPDVVSEVYKVHRLKDNNWKEEHVKNTIDDETMMMASSLLRQGSQRDLLDFDNHFDDLQNDWRNQEINEAIKKMS